MIWEWVKVIDIKNKWFRHQGLVLDLKRGKKQVELDLGNGNSIYRWFGRNQLKTISKFKRK